MKRHAIICVLTVGLLLGLFRLSVAAPYLFDMGAGSWVDTSGTNTYLKTEAKVNADLDSIIFSLDEGQSRSFYFARFYTKETWINQDDLNPGTLTAYVDFDNPDLMPAIGGTSIGFSANWNFTQGWNLTWVDPVIVNFGKGGQFAISLSDVGYTSWFWQGPDGCGADVEATVTLNHAPVPLPGTLVLLFSALFGFVGMRRVRG
jgi:hypothetical protein